MGTKPVMIEERWHAALSYITLTRQARLKKRVTLKSVLESAFEAAFGKIEDIEEEMNTLNEPIAAARVFAEMDEETLFAHMANAVYVHKHTNEYIERFGELRTCDHMGRKDALLVKNLTYYMRTTKRRIGNLQDLRIAFAFGQ